MNPEDQQIYEEPYEEVYDENVVYEHERVQPVIDLSILQMPFWLKISLLLAALVILGAVVIFTNVSYQGPQFAPVQIPEGSDSFFPPQIPEYGTPSASGTQNKKPDAVYGGDPNELVQKYPQAYDSGDLFIKRYDVGQKQVFKLLFKNEADGIIYQVATLLGQPIWYNFYVADTKLYYFGRNADANPSYSLEPHQIYYIDLKTFAQGTIERADSFTNPYIGDLYVYGGDLYYLSGSNDIYRCVDGPARDCSLTLRKLSLRDLRNNVILATSTPATTFIGYAVDQQALFMYTGYGDAGCVGKQLYIYEHGVVTEGPELGGCADMLNGDDSPEFKQYLEEMHKLDAAVSIPTAKAIHKAYSQYIPAEAEYDIYTDIYFVK